MRPVAALAVVLTVAAGEASAAAPGSQANPIVVRMKRGADSMRLTGVLRQNRDCCSYRFKARAGQTLDWTVQGPAIRVTMTYPDGHTDGPGLPAAIPLTADGVYVFRVSPNLMADGAFGRFVLKFRIPAR